MFGRMPLFLTHLFFLFIFLLSNHHEHTLFILIFHMKAFFALLLARAWAPKACVEDLIIYYYSLMVNFTLDLSKLLYVM